MSSSPAQVGKSARDETLTETRPTVSVIIPTFRRRHQLLGLLASLRAGSVVPDEVIVVDNDPDGPVDISDAELPAKVIYLGAGPNVARAKNVGWRAANSDVCMFIDDDNIIDPSMVAALLSAIDSPGVGLVTPVIYAADSGRVWTGGTYRSFWTGITRCQYHGAPAFPDADTWPTHGAPDIYAVRRQVLEAIAGIEEHRFPMGEDEADLYMRLASRGLASVVVKGAVARHYGFVTENPGLALVRATMIHGPERARLMARGRVWYQRTHSKGAAKLTTLVVFVPLWGLATAIACMVARAPLDGRRRAVFALAAGLFEGYRAPLPAGVGNTGTTEEASSALVPRMTPRFERLRQLAAASRRTFRAWYLIGPVVAVVAPSMIPPRRGVSKLADRSVTLRLRAGPNMTCHINEVFNVIEVFGMDSYDMGDIPWQTLGTIVDVGANIGSSVIWFAQRSPYARIIAIEPGNTTVRRLRDHIDRAGIASRVSIVHSGLGAESGEACLVDTWSSALAYTVPLDDGNVTPAGERVTIRLLEDVLDELNVEHVDLLKLDCEGAEYEVILSASDQCLGRVDRIVGEYNKIEGRDPAEMFRRLTEAGFDVSEHPEAADEAIDMKLFYKVVEHGETPALGMFIAVRRQMPVR